MHGNVALYHTADIVGMQTYFVYTSVCYVHDGWLHNIACFKIKTKCTFQYFQFLAYDTVCIILQYEIDLIVLF